MAATLLALNPSFILYPRAVLSFPALSSLLHYHFYSMLVFTALSTVWWGGSQKNGTISNVLIKPWSQADALSLDLVGQGVLTEHVFLPLLKCYLVTQHILLFRVIILQNQQLFLFLFRSSFSKCNAPVLQGNHFCCPSFYRLNLLFEGGENGLCRILAIPTISHHHKHISRIISAAICPFLMGLKEENPSKPV